MAKRKSPRIQLPQRPRPRTEQDAFVQEKEPTNPSHKVARHQTTRLTVDLPDEVYMKLKVKAALSRQTMVSIVRQMLQEHL